MPIRRAFSMLLSLVCMHGAAQEFVTLSAEDLKVDTIVPRFAMVKELGPNYADSIYEATIEYPEFADMPEADVARYQALSGQPLTAMPAIEQYIGVSRKQGALHLSLVPLVFREGRYQRLVSFKMAVKAKPVPAATATSAPPAASNGRYASHSALATGHWTKIRIPETGFYQLTDSLIREAGFTNLSKVKVYGYGGALQPEKLTSGYLEDTDDLQEVPTCLIDGQRMFFGTGPVNWSRVTLVTRTRNQYSSYGYYLLTETEAEPAMLDSISFVDEHYPIANDYYSLYEVDDYSWFHGGRNLYDHELFGPGVARNYNMAAYSEAGNLAICMSYDAYFTAEVLVNGQLVGTLKVDDSTQRSPATKHPYPDVYSRAASDTWNFRLTEGLTPSSEVTIRQLSGGNIRLDYIQLRSDAPRALPSLTAATVPQPELVGPVDNQNHHADGAVDMVIIIPSSQNLLAEAQRLKQLHEQYDNLRVRIVPANELYNEYSSGTPDANAYRRYLKQLYDQAETEADQPRYLLLFGDGAWDNRMLTSDWRTFSPDDFLLCYESENSFSETKCYVTDDYFCYLDDNEGADMLMRDFADVAVGRLPARTPEEAKILVDKIYSYRLNEQAGAWQNTICFMGDDGNKNMHMDSADRVASYIDETYPCYNIKKVYWDAYTRTSTATGNRYPDATRLIKQQMQDGALIMNYTGHGAPYCLSHEQVVLRSDFAASTSLRLPLWFTASCDIMPFDGQEENIGETAMLNPNGGAIAFYGTTRTVYAEANHPMDSVFMYHVLGSRDGVRNTIGEAVRLAKNELITPNDKGKLIDPTENKFQFTLLGDPALTLNAPTLSLSIDSINGQNVADGEQRLPAGSVVTVTGHIPDAESFSGIASIAVRDVAETIVCRVNETSEGQKPKAPFVFQDRPSTIYQGSDSVRNGRFTFTFAVPKDITYSDDCGQMLVYAVNSERTLAAHGQTESFSMGDTEDSGDDGSGPVIDCYLDAPTFTDGDTVGPTPCFYARLSDENGINAAGSGIGHDLELVIDGQMALTYNLNNVFQYEFGDFRQGSLCYTLPRLYNGPHHLLFRAWDVLNNSSVVELNFVVDSNYDPLGISDLEAMPQRGARSVYDVYGRRVQGGASQHAPSLRIYRDELGNVKKMMHKRQ